VNHKKYVGVTNNFSKRMREHKGCYKKNHLLYRAIKKYSWNKFNHEIIFQTKNKDYAYKEAESFFIMEYNSNNPEFGYNLTSGGEGTSGYIVSDSTRKKQSLAKKGRKLSKEHAEKLRNSNKGRIVSTETKQKISEKLKGNKNFLGKGFTDEVKQKLSDQKSKEWTVISPEGNIVFLRNMRKFCIENELSPSAMSRVMKGMQHHHKGWTSPIQCSPTTMLPCTVHA
jgi:group I intron endonuclease